MAPQATRRLENRELAGPRGEPRGAAVGVELREHGHEGVVRGLHAEIVDLLAGSPGKRRAAPGGDPPRDPQEQGMQARDGVVPRRPCVSEVAQPVGRFLVGGDGFHGGPQSIRLRAGLLRQA